MTLGTIGDMVVLQSLSYTIIFFTFFLFTPESFSIVTFYAILFFRSCCWEGYTIGIWWIWLDIVLKRGNVCLYMYTWVTVAWHPTCIVSHLSIFFHEMHRLFFCTNFCPWICSCKHVSIRKFLLSLVESQKLIFSDTEIHLRG